MFLAVLLAILKFILYFVLISLAIIFIVSLIILVSAIKYDVHIKTSDLFTNPKGTMARVNVSWLFGILKLKIVYIKNKLKTQVFVFGLCVNRKRRKGKNAKEGLDYENTEVTIASDDPKLKTRAEPQGGVENKNIEIKNIEAQKIGHDAKTEKTKNIKPKKVKKQKSPKIKKYKSESILNRLKYAYNYPDRKKITDSFFRMVKRIFKHLKPKYFKLRVMLGMDDPCLTGEIVGAAAVFSGVFHKNIFLKGNFLEKEAIVKLGVNGRVRLGSFLVSAIRFIFYIPVMKAIVKLVKYYFKLNKQKKIQEDI